MRIILAITFLCNFFFYIANGQNSAVLFGKITDSETGEYLIGATISCADNFSGVSSNNYGYYALKFPEGKYKIKFSHIGYESVVKEIQIYNEYELNISIKPISKNLEEVVIIADKIEEIATSSKSGYNKLNLNQIENIPSVAGVNDILKTIQLLPGIQTTNEGTVGFNVRGGSFDQNLILLDEAPIYNPSHALGFFSTINSDMIKDVSVYKGDFQAKYGGRVSSVVDIRLREGNNQEYKLQGDVGILSSGLIFEGPVKKNKSSFIIAGRYSYAGWMANNLYEVGDILYLPSLNNFKNGNDVYFYDINAKFNIDFNSKNRLFISAYNGLDYFYSSNIDDRSKLQWGNTIGTVRWSHRESARLFMNTSLIYSKYNYSNKFESTSFGQDWSSDIQNINFKYDVDYYHSSVHQIAFGVSLEYLNINPGSLKINDTISSSKNQSLPIEKSLQTNIYLSDKWSIADNLIVNIGLRASAYGVLGNGYTYSYNSQDVKTDSLWFASNEFEKKYYFVEPRFSIMYSFSNNSSMKLSYTNANQPLHQISNTSISLPTDIWVSSDENVKPITSNSVSLGYYKTLNKNIDISIESYFKRIDHVIDYIDNADILMNEDLSTQIKSGFANAYGVEILLRKNSNKLNGWLSYAYSHVDYNISGINGNESYFPRHEKPHNLSLVLNYNLSRRLIINTVFKYNSGGYISVPEGTFYYNGASFNYYTERNGYELPAYHRLDIGLKYLSKNNERKWKGEWDIGVYNAYGRKNTFSLYTRASLETISVFKMYVFGVTPYLTYSFKF